ncbi:MAG: GAF domain-containing sensor histidine kinase, partial [Chloroflexota bacterium]
AETPALLTTKLNVCTDCQTLILPLILSGETIGLIYALVAANYHPSLLELQLPKAMAIQSAIAIQNALLLSDVTQGHDRLTAVLDAVGDGVLMINATGEITVGNHPIEVITNTPMDKIIHQQLGTIPELALSAIGFTVEDTKNLIKQSNQTDMIKQHSRHNYKHAEHYFKRSTVALSGPQNETLGWVIVNRDGTEEHQINQTKKLLTETLVHDLRSPVGTIDTTIELIREAIPKEERDPITDQSLDIAKRSTTRVLNLINSLLDISHLETGNLDLRVESVQFHDLIAETFSQMVPQANEAGILLLQILPNNLPKIKIDPNLNQRVLTNLIDNSLKFTPEGGRVEISVEALEDKFVTAHVSDTGPGIPIEHQENIFERFNQIPGSRGRKRGSGLGLTFCQLAIEAHGGEIWVNQTKMDKGTVFSFTLPSATVKQPMK